MAWSQSLVIAWIEFTLAAAVLLQLARFTLPRLPQPAESIRVIQITLATAMALPLLLAFAPWPAWKIRWLAPRDQSPAPAATVVQSEVMDFPAIPSHEFLTTLPAMEPPITRPFDDVQSTAEARPSLPATVAAPLPHQAWPSPSPWTLAALAIGALHALAFVWFAIEWGIGIISLRRLCCDATPATVKVERLWNQITQAANHQVRLLISPAIDVPLMFGGLRPVVLIPQDLADAGGTPLRYCLAHEWAHVERRDHLAWRLAGACQFLLWPQPAYWGLLKELRLCQDLLADDRATRIAGDAVAYSELLLDFAKKQHSVHLAGALSFVDQRSQLTRRVKMLLERPLMVRPACTWRFSLAAAAMAACWAVLVSSVRIDTAQAEDGKPATTAAQESPKPGPATAKLEVVSRAWDILSQTDADSLLFGLAPRLGRASESSRRSENSWNGVEGGGSVELDIDVQDDIDGEILIGFFADPRWWIAEPIQVRKFDKPGLYKIDRLPLGEYQIGAMIGDAAHPQALGLHRTWPAPITVAAGNPSKMELRISPKFRDMQFSHLGTYRDSIADQQSVANREKVVTLRTVDHQRNVVPFSRIVVVERQKEDTEKVHTYHNLGTNDAGRAYSDNFDGAFSLDCQRCDFDPETFVARFQFQRENKLYDTRRDRSIEVTFDNMPRGTGRIRGRVHDQDGQPLKTYFLYLNTDRTKDKQFDLKQPVTDLEGRFEVRGLAPGEYHIMVRHFDYLAYDWSFDRPKVTVPNEPDAVAEIDIEVEAKELRYGQAVFEDGTPVTSGGSVTTWFLRQPNTPWGGEHRSTSLEPDGTFRVALSEEEQQRLTKNSQGLVEIKAYNRESTKVKAETSVMFSDLSISPEQPTTVQLLPPKPKADDDSKSRKVSDADAQSKKPWNDAHGKEANITEQAVAIEADAILSIAVSPNGALVAGGGLGKQVRVWDSQTGELVHQFDGHGPLVRAVAFHPDGNLLATADDEGVVRLWDVSAGAIRRTIRAPKRNFRALTFSPDGALLTACALVNRDKQLLTDVFVWRADTGELVHQVSPSDFYGLEVTFSPDGQWLAASYNTVQEQQLVSSGVKFWSTKTWEQSKTVKSDRGASYSGAFSPDGKRIAIGGGHWNDRATDKQLISDVVLWNLETGKVERTLTRDVQAGSVHVRFSPDGKSLVGQHYGRSFSFPKESRFMSEVTLWDVKTGEEKWTEALPFAPDATPPIFLPDGRTLVSRDEQAVRVLDAATGETLRLLMEVTRKPTDR